MNFKMNYFQTAPNQTAPKFSAVMSLNKAYYLHPKNSQTPDQRDQEAQQLKEICQALGPDELLLVEESDEGGRYLFLVNGEDRSMVECLTRLAKQQEKTEPERAKQIYRKIFTHLYESAFRMKFDWHNSAFRSVSTAFRLMKEGILEDKEV